MSRDTVAPDEVVSRDPDVHSGDLVFAGTRVPVRILLDYLKDGASLDEFYENYPTVGRKQVEALLDLGVEAIDPARRD